MALDYLAIQGSATPIERVWSSAAETDTKRRNRLAPTRLEALQFLKAGYRRRRSQKQSAEEKEAAQKRHLTLIDNGVWEDDILDDDDLYFPEIDEEKVEG